MNVEPRIISIYREVLDGKLDKFPRDFWKDNYNQLHAGILTRYLIENILQWDKEQIKKSFKSETLENHKLSGMFKYVYKKNVFSVIEDAYPLEFNPWELPQAPNSYWRNKNNCIVATQWLIEERLRWTIEEVKEKFNKNAFQDNGLTGLLKWGWNGSIFDAVDSVYPNQIKPWELGCAPNDYWTEETAIKAFKWLIEEKEMWSHKEIKKNWRSRVLKRFGLLTPVITKFDNNMFKAIDAVYPGRFSKNDFPLYRKGAVKSKKQANDDKDMQKAD